MNNTEIEQDARRAAIEPNEAQVAGLTLKRMTSASLALCEMANLSMVKAEGGDPTTFEMLAFLYLHSAPAREVRGSLFDESRGATQGRSVAFVEAVMDWAEDVSIKDYTQAAQGIAQMMKDSFTGMVEAIPDDEFGEPKKKKRGRPRKVS